MIKVLQHKDEKNDKTPFSLVNYEFVFAGTRLKNLWRIWVGAFWKKRIRSAHIRLVSRSPESGCVHVSP